MADDADTPTRHVTLSDVKDLLEKEREARGELTYEQKLAYEHANLFAQYSPEDARELVEKLQQIGRITEAQAVKIADVAPVEEEDVEAVFSKDRYTPDADEIDKVISLVLEYQ